MISLASQKKILKRKKNKKKEKSIKNNLSGKNKTTGNYTIKKGRNANFKEKNESFKT